MAAGKASGSEKGVGASSGRQRVVPRFGTGLLAAGVGGTLFALGILLLGILTGEQKLSGLHSGARHNARVSVLVGAGDISSCKTTGDSATAKLLGKIPGTVVALGDEAYDSGTYPQFKHCYGPTWGRYKDRTRPAPGNHDYVTKKAAGYYRYFGARAGKNHRGYYSYNLGRWHIISLNSMCEDTGGCGFRSPQIRWLRKDLASHHRRCTLAYWHHSVFSSGSEHGSDPRMKPALRALYRAHADVVLSGHDHDYERFAPQSPQGTLKPSRGIREFVVGTGGRSLNPFGRILPHSQARNSKAYGVLKLTLYPRSYHWRFVPVAGKSFTDSGTTRCH